MTTRQTNIPYLPLFATLIIMLTAMDTAGQILQKNTQVKFLALGDSYTIGESVGEGQRWPAQLVSALMLKGFTCHQPVIVAVTGWRTDQLMIAMEKRNLETDYTLVSLLIGVNNQYQGKSVDTYRAEFAELLEMAIAHADGNASAVFVLSIPDYGYTPFGKERRSEISKHIDAFNEVNKHVTTKRGVLYIDITDISRRGLQEPQLIADDRLHPSGKMYALWVERILQKVSPD